MIVDGVILVTIAILSLRAYEAIVHLGPVLAFACMLRVRRMSAGSSAARVLTIVAAITFMLAAALAFRAILYPRDPANFSGALNVAG